MKMETQIAGRAGELQIEGSTFRYQREDGAAAEGEFSIIDLEPGCYSILIGGRSYRVSGGGAGEVAVNGKTLAVELFDPRSLRGRKSGGASHGRQSIAALMPGKVVRVLVAVGDQVEAGQGLVVVEAMKMQNEMKSPKDGYVVEVKTRPGAAVVAGEVLIVVE
jgi:biotin carboxyl carrier protein